MLYFQLSVKDGGVTGTITLSAIIGLAGGAAVLFCITKITNAVTSQGKMPLALILLMTVLPLALLLVTAFTMPTRLIITGSCMAGVAVIGAVVKFIIANKKRKEAEHK